MCKTSGFNKSLLSLHAQVLPQLELPTERRAGQLGLAMLDFTLDNAAN
jgi:hypothetical protein